ncbi:MAG: ABC transporter permease [Thermodesulfobacteriota bacterium]
MILEMAVPLLAATIQSGTPILLATLGEMITEKSGILNLGVEGMMLVGAFGGFFVSYQTGSPWLGLLGAGIFAALFSGIHALICVTFLGNQVVSGLALTILGTGLANFLGNPYIGQEAPGFSKFSLPFLADIPFLGDILFQQDALVYLSYLAPVLVFIFLSRTKWGLRLRAVGEHPAAAKSAGIGVLRYRWLGVMLGGFLVGLGGAYLSLAYTHLWTTNLTGGRGWIAVALVIFAFWRPFRAMAGAYLFGGIMAFQLRVQALGTDIPSSFLLMLPYVLTIVVLVMSFRKGLMHGAPGGLGVNFEPEE